MQRFATLRRQTSLGHVGGSSVNYGGGGGLTGLGGTNMYTNVGNNYNNIGGNGGKNIPLPDTTGSNNYVSIPSSTIPSGILDASDEEVNQLLKELECSVEGPYAVDVLRDAVGAIERRAFANCDPMSRDLFLEQRIRDVLSELSRTSNPRLLLLAVDFIDALLGVPYTNPQQKFTRLCRSLFIILHSGLEKPAKEAQRVLKRMLEMDLQFGPFDPPLKLFITKELKDNCELALMQLHGRTQQTKAPFKAQFLAVMLALAATAEINSRYMSNPLRTYAVKLATALSGSTDEILRSAAYDCLVSIFSHTNAMKHNEIVLETRRVLDDAIRSLNTSHNNENSIISTLQSLRALISSRGLQFMEKQLSILPQICVLVAEQHRVSKSQSIRNAVCNLVPIIAETDILSPPRRITYCAIIMEPIKNIRDERNKSLELHNVAIFIQNVGYDILDSTNRTNLDSILLRYISRRETQEECWHILAAICKSYLLQEMKRIQFGSRSVWSFGASCCGNKSDVQTIMESNSPHTDILLPVSNNNSMTALVKNNTQINISKQQETIQHVDELTRRFIPYLGHAMLSTELVRYISIIQQHVSSVSMELQEALDYLVNCKLKDDSYLNLKQTDIGNRILQNSRDASSGVTMGVNIPQPHHESTYALNSNIPNSTMGRLAQYFRPPPVMETNNSQLNRVSTTNDIGGSHLNANIRGTTGMSITSEGNYNTLTNRTTAVTSSIVTGPTTIQTTQTTPPPTTTTTGPNNNTTLTTTTVVTGPTTTTTTGGGGGGGGGGGTTLSIYPVSASELTIALEVFAKRPITSGTQLQEIHDFIIYYQRHNDTYVRQQCSICIVEVLSHWIHYTEEHCISPCMTYVTQILEIYLKNILIESDPKVRIMEITLLTNTIELRSFLLEKRNLKILLSFLHDTSRVREKTVELLLLLLQELKSNISIGMIQQNLLDIVESSVVALEYSSDCRILIQHMSDLQIFAKFSLNLLKNYIHRIFIAFQKQLKEETVIDTIALSILKTLDTILGTLEKEGGEDRENKKEEEKDLILQYQDDISELYPFIMGTLRWSTSSSLSHLSISVLVKMHNIGASPYEWDITQLHDLMQSLISVYISSVNITEKELENVLSLFGQLGAVDPATKPDNAIIKKKDDEAAIQDEADLEFTFDYTVIVYRDLSRMLDVGLSEMVCIQAMRTLLHLVQTTTDRRELIGGAHAVKAVLQIAKRSVDNPSLRLEALHILAAVTSLRYEKISKTLLPEIIVLLEQLWYTHDHALFRAVLNVVSALKPGNLSGKEQAEVWPWLYPRLVDVALQDRSESREFCLCVVGIMLHASYIPPHCISVVFPMLMQFVQRLDQLAEVRSLSLCASIHIVCYLKAGQYFSSLIHAIGILTRHCELSEDLGPRLSTSMVHNALRVFVGMYPSAKTTVRALREWLRDVDEVSSPGPTVSSSTATVEENRSDFSTTVASQLTSSYFHRYQKHQHQHQHQQQQQQQRELRQGGNHYFDNQDDDHYDTYLQGQQDITLFMKHVEFGLRTKDNKWREWFAEFQKVLIMVSPHPVFRIMIDLFDKHEMFRRKLFHPSFKCLYESLNAEHMKKVNEVLNIALRSTDSEVVSKCLGLADYLDHNPPRINENVLQQLRSLENNESTTQTMTNTFYFTTGHPSNTISDNFSFESPEHSIPSLQQREGEEGELQQTGLKSVISNILENPLLGVNSGYLNIDTSTTDITHMHIKKKELGENNTMGTEFHPLARPMALTKKQHHLQQQNQQQQNQQQSVMYPRASPIPNNVNPLFTTESLVEAAQRTRMYDKVISYLEYKALPIVEKYRYKHCVPKDAMHAVVLPLAWVYSKREMQDSVVGLFRAMRYKTDNEDGLSYELLQWWDVAQRVYAGKIKKLNKSTLVDFKGYVRTLCLCGEWETALHVIKTASPQLIQSSSAIAESGAMAAWILGEWDDVKLLKENIPVKEKVNTGLRLFFHNAACFHDEFFNNSSNSNSSLSINHLCASITRAKMEVNESLKTLLPLSYAHAYENLTLLQHFTEMEEQISFMQSKSIVFRKQLVERWKRRFTALKPDSLMPSLRSLMLHSLVLQPTEMSDMILNFCERMGTNYPQLSVWAMSWLQQGQFPRGSHQYKRERVTSTALLSFQPSVAVVYISQVWSEGQRWEAVRMMEEFLNGTQPNLQEEHPLCYGGAQLRLGEWKQEMYADSFWNCDNRQEVLRHFHEAIRALPENYEAWHSWGLMNYRVQQRDSSLSVDDQRFFVEAAHQGFVAAICRSSSPSTALPGIMRLLHLWVFHNGVSMLKESVADSVSRIPTDHWVQAIPQLIGHLSDTRYGVREVISMILRQLCEVHSQAVVFPLLVVLMSDDGSGGPQLRRQELAKSIITELPKRIRADAELVAKLLIDVSAIPIEKIREHLSAVAAAWNPDTECEDPEEIQRRLRTVLDIFNADKRHLLYTVGDIGQYVEMVLKDEKRGDREKASNIISQLVDEITKHISEKLGKEIQKAMDPLLNLRNLSIAVFGEYDIRYTNFPTIASFSSKLDVIPSRKRPRRIRLSGSNGFIYTYCLKGNEDIRMDERAMQLFGMVNVLLKYAHTANSAFIHRFPVIPISNNVGLLGWVEHANTINNTICIHRNTISNLSTHQESNVLRSYVESFGKWSKLSMIQRTEVLEYVMGQPDCEAVDIARAMWNRSPTAEQWLERRTAFTLSLATMSMVGYVLGLGDRHLGNILLSMSTGKIVHIDFGDSFDVGRLRHMLPETIPFRLTRMLTNAMEVFGVDGIFRSSCTRTQTLLHMNRDSIMALLSAFVHDPIVQHKGRMKNMMEKSRSLQDIAERIRNKLRGAEMAVKPDDMIIFNTALESIRRPDLLYMSNAFNDAARRSLNKMLTAPQQVSMLIDEATRVENYAALYFGWGPLW